jgi:hypothetical protein
VEQPCDCAVPVSAQSGVQPMMQARPFGPTCGWECPDYLYSSGGGWYTWLYFCCPPGSGLVYINTQNPNIQPCTGCGTSTDPCPKASGAPISTPQSIAKGGIAYEKNGFYLHSANPGQSAFYKDGGRKLQKSELKYDLVKPGDPAQKSDVTVQGRHIVLYKFTPRSDPKITFPICVGFQVTDAEGTPTSPDDATFPDLKNFPYYLQITKGNDIYHAVVLK